MAELACESGVGCGRLAGLGVPGRRRVEGTPCGRHLLGRAGLPGSAARADPDFAGPRAGEHRGENVRHGGAQRLPLSTSATRGSGIAGPGDRSSPLAGSARPTRGHRRAAVRASAVPETEARRAGPARRQRRRARVRISDQRRGARPRVRPDDLSLPAANDR